ncbi:MAG: hypothetical protein Q4C50_11460 [Eubacteriales bacterium]|nr:hypothetical protein [Eubacteriales bacterium]
MELHGIYDKGFVLLKSWLGQAVVTMFIFYSGYGVYESIKLKGKEYISAFPRRRILITLVNYALAILIFLCADLMLGKVPKATNILLAFTGWTSIGNSNWYIFAMLCLYIITWLSFIVFSKNHAAALCSVTLLSLVYVILMQRFKPSEGWWYNTFFCYAMGMWYSFCKESIEEFLRRGGHYFLALFSVSFCVLLLRPFTKHLIIYETWSLLFTAMVVLITMKVSIHSRLLYWCGKHTFELYILQRLPMMILHNFHIDQYPYVFLLLTLACIFPMVYLFSKLLHMVDNKILSVT